MQVGKYLVREELLVAGPSTFYRAENSILGNDVLLRRLTVDPERADAVRDTFFREQRLMAALGHPRIQTALDVFEEQGQLWSVHEYKALKSALQSMERSGPFPVAEAARISSQIASALAHMHARGHVHGKVTPATVFVEEGGDAQLVNFVKAADLAAGIWPLRPAVLGLSPFSAPEEFRGERPTEATDVYGLAATIFYWLTTRWPRGGEGEEEALERARERAPLLDLRALRPEVPVALADRLNVALSAEPAERHANMAALESVFVESHQRYAAEVPSGFTSGTTLRPGGCDVGVEILGRHGAGAYGVVLKAHSSACEGPVAVKALKPEHRDNHEALERFLREARALQQIDHPNVVRIYGVGEEHGTPYALMEFIDGPDLATVLLREGSLPPARVAKLGAAIARGIAAIHEGGIIHRDLKPHNVLVADGDRPVIADFGVARQSGLTRMTMTGGLVGTPLYMAPEQFGAEPVTPAADLYAFGTMLYELLAGSVPFGGKDTVTTIQSICLTPPPPLPPEVPAELAAVVFHLLEKVPGDRQESAVQVAEELELLAGTLPEAPALR